ncbi:hypothetical protein [Cellulomonas sp. URHE0023]|uniref:hypothetical protein n=1 Tax=Cellulomonas sp. URHE0023 TaxID=1380354 RepID=UPI000482949D|nr:hypothetical protein [Cellulomonas sp. URHE0023]
MGLALLCVAGAALCSGGAIVVQALAMRRMPVDSRLDVALVGGLARNRTYLAALVLVASGFILSFLALQTLPLFVVQAGRASSLAVAAILSVLVLGARLRWTDWLGLSGLAVGLVLLASSVDPRPAVPVSTSTLWWVLALTIAVLATTALVALGPPTPVRGLVLAVLAGLSFGVLALGARTATSWTPVDLVTNPVIWCAGACGALGLAASAIALRRAPVVPVTALMVGTETVTGAALGLLFAGDRTAEGTGGAAAAGFALVLAGALVVARFGASEGDR